MIGKIRSITILDSQCVGDGIAILCMVYRAPHYIKFGNSKGLTTEEKFYYVGDKYNVFKLGGMYVNNKYGTRKWLNESSEFVGPEVDRMVNLEYHRIEKSGEHKNYKVKNDLDRRRDSVRCLQAVADWD